MTRAARRAFLAFLQVLPLLASPITAAKAMPPIPPGVRLEMGANGRKMIFNESSTQRERRFADRLVPIPAADLAPLIARHSSLQNLDPKLVRALIQIESGYNDRALSNKGAMGLMQLVPDTANDLAVRNPYDPEENVRGGTTYLRRLLDRFSGSLELALAAYNAGPGAVERHGGVPPYPETRDYVRRILSLYNGRETPVQALETVRFTPPSALGASGAGGAAGALGQRPRGGKAIVIRGPNNRLLLTTTTDAVR
jgi:soluble lytic murein transglycosylase